MKSTLQLSNDVVLHKLSNEEVRTLSVPYIYLSGQLVRVVPALDTHTQCRFNSRSLTDLTAAPFERSANGRLETLRQGDNYHARARALWSTLTLSASVISAFAQRLTIQLLLRAIERSVNISLHWRPAGARGARLDTSDHTHLDRLHGRSLTRNIARL